MVDVKSEKEKRPEHQSLRQLLQDYPDSSQRVIGSGTVHVDPEEIRQSQNYKDMVAKIREYGLAG